MEIKNIFQLTPLSKVKKIIYKIMPVKKITKATKTTMVDVSGPQSQEMWAVVCPKDGVLAVADRKDGMTQPKDECDSWVKVMVSYTIPKTK